MPFTMSPEVIVGVMTLLVTFTTSLLIMAYRLGRISKTVDDHTKDIVEDKKAQKELSTAIGAISTAIVRLETLAEKAQETQSSNVDRISRVELSVDAHHGDRELHVTPGWANRIEAKIDLLMSQK